MEWAKELVGKSFEEAEAIATTMGYVIRPTVVDGQPIGVTTDFRTDRLNVSITNNIVDYVDERVG